ncbi:hypothetical protein JCM8097_009555 [Rhodosporidiobolus ruineniae]
MGSPPIPDRSPPPQPSTSRSSIPPAFRNRSPPAPHPGIQPARAPSSVPFSPPKRKTGGSIKGKERAIDQDGQEGAAAAGGDPDFPPQTVPTYRHLLGQGNGGAANPLRTIAHIDIDAAYAAMEMARLGIPEDQPMCVQQWNGLIAVNYPARRFGITRHEAPAEALKKCPHLRLVHVQTYRNGEPEPGYWEGAKPETHKVSLDMYRKESKKILDVFSEFCPVVEKASIDESYLDLTLPVRKLLLSAHPSLSSPPPGSDLDSPLPPPSSLGVTPESIDWDALGNLVPVAGQKKEKVRGLLADGTEAPPSSSPVKPGDEPPEDAAPPPAAVESDLSAFTGPSTSRSPSPSEPPEPPLSWSDICLSLGASVVKETRAAVRERLGYTCSAGIATNKMLAKLTSAWKKPNAQTVLRHSAVPAFLRPLPFQKIRNLGGKLGTAVKETYEAETVGDLLKFTLPELKAKLGDDSGVWLWEIVRGLDYTEVETKTQVKSMLSSKNFRPYISTYGEVLHWLNILATELHLRLKDAREESPGLWPKTITFTHRSPTFVIRSHQAPFPFTSTPSAAYILKHAEKLVRIAMGGTTPASANVKLPDGTKIGPYGNIQLAFSGLERLEEGQRGIEGFFGAAGAATGAAGGAKKRAATTVAAPKQAEEEEREEVKPKKKKRKVNPPPPAPPPAATSIGGAGPIELILSDSDDSSPSPPPPPPEKKPKRTASGPGKSPLEDAFACERCGKEVVFQLSAQGKREEERRKAEGEHQDWHVARDLLEKDRKQNGWGASSSSSSNSSKTKPATKSKTKMKSTAKDGAGGKKGKKVSTKKAADGTLNGFFRPKE